MYDIRAHVLIGKVLSEKECMLTCKEGKFLVPDAELLVWRKQEVQRIPAKQIGDGMKLILYYPARQFVVSSPHALEAGLSVYKEYDETDDLWATYLYKYAGGDEGREKINAFLRQVGSTGALSVEKGFTRLSGTVLSVPDLLTLTATIDLQVAFMIGLCLGYGKPKQISETHLMSWHVGIPLTGTLATVYPVLETIWENLAHQGIFMVRSLQQQRLGTLVQLTIYDERLLDILEGIWTGEKSSGGRYEQILAKVHQEIGEDDDRLSNSVLKFVSK